MTIPVFGHFVTKASLAQKRVLFTCDQNKDSKFFKNLLYIG